MSVLIVVDAWDSFGNRTCLAFLHDQLVCIDGVAEGDTDGQKITFKTGHEKACLVHRQPILAACCDLHPTVGLSGVSGTTICNSVTLPASCPLSLPLPQRM